MGLVLVQTFKSSTLPSFTREWCNSYLIEAATPAYNETFGNLAESFVQIERNFYLTGVTIQRVTFTQWHLSEDTNEQMHSCVFVPQHAPVFGVRPVTDPATFDHCLTFGKRVKAGRPGRLWLRGCLNYDDLRVGQEKRIGLHNSSILNQWTPEDLSALWGYVMPLLRVPVMAGAIRFPLLVLPVESWVLHGVSITKSQERQRGKIHAKSLQIYQEISGMLSAIALQVKDVGYELAIYGEFSEPILKDHVTQTLALIGVVMENVKTYFDEGPGTLAPSDPSVYIRFGRTEDFIRALAQQCKTKVEQDQLILNEMLPYQFVDGELYLHHSDTQALYDMVTWYGEKLGVLLDVDWLNPMAFRAWQGT